MLDSPSILNRIVQGCNNIKYLLRHWFMCYLTDDKLNLRLDNFWRCSIEQSCGKLGVKFFVDLRKLSLKRFVNGNAEKELGEENKECLHDWLLGLPAQANQGCQDTHHHGNSS